MAKYYEVFKKTGSIFNSMDKHEQKEEGNNFRRRMKYIKIIIHENKNHINMCFVKSNKFYYKCMVSLLIYLIGDFIYSSVLSYVTGDFIYSSVLSYVTGDFIYIFICLLTIVLGMGVLN